MASIHNNQKFIILIIFSLLFISFSHTVLAKSRRPISEAEIREKKLQCYADIESGLWGEKCIATAVDKENCALQCLSPVCYERVYQSDPLEEGEKDTVRSQEYKYCMHKLERLGSCTNEGIPWGRAWMILKVPSSGNSANMPAWLVNSCVFSHSQLPVVCMMFVVWMLIDSF